MTLFTITHLDGTKSTRESNKDLRWAVVVYTPKETRQKIVEAVLQVDAAVRDNVHRALADGTVSERDGVTYIGGIAATSRGDLLHTWEEANDAWNYMSAVELPDLYQATHWLSNLADALNAGNRLQDEYDATPWRRTVYVKPVSEAV